MKPLAKLVIRKLREYKKSCRDQDETFLDFNEVTSLSGSTNNIRSYYLNTYLLKFWLGEKLKTGYN